MPASEQNALEIELHLPPRCPGGSPVDLKCRGQVVITGGNGAGKSRLGYWIEEHQKDPTLTHRLSAQKILAMTPSIGLTPLESAEKQWRWGNPHLQVLSGPDISRSRRLNRYRVQDLADELSVSTTLDDFGAVLSVLYGKRREVSEKIHADLRLKEQVASADYPKGPDEVLLDIWDRVMPQRKLRFGPDRIEASVDGLTWYNAREMSDGERVALYLLAQCLLVPEQSTVIVDEPELHLSRSILSRLWDEIERSRASCLFVYITHDLDFALSRANARKIWVKTYDGTNWDWEVISDEYGFPEAVVVEVLGSRRRVLFCEGEQGSIDQQIYRAIYPDMILPRGGCAKVIEATKALRSDPRLHHLNPRALVDGDYRSDVEIAALATNGVDVLRVAEAESLLCTPPVLRAVARHLSRNPNETEQKAKGLMFAELKRELPIQARNCAIAQLTFALNGFSPTNEDPGDAHAELERYIATTANYANLYREALRLYSDILDQQDYEQALRSFNQKGLYHLIAQALGVTGETYRRIVFKLLSENTPTNLRKELQAYLPF